MIFLSGLAFGQGQAGKDVTGAVAIESPMEVKADVQVRSDVAPKACVIAGTVDESLIQKYPAVVYIEKADGMFRPQTVEMGQIKLAFAPHLLPVVVGSTVVFQNSDDVNHNIFSPDNEKYNLGSFGKGMSASHTFKEPGVYTQLCNVHPEMEAYIVVLQNPYFAVVTKEKAGKFEMPDVPPGDYTIKIWGEQLKKRELKIETPVKVEKGKQSVVRIAAPESKPKAK